jgi:5-methylcytosine-specific restriction endonuclease McrA
MANPFGLPKFKTPKINVYGDFSQSNNTKRKALGKPLRDAVWLKYMGNKAQGKCYCCKIRTIHITDFQVGHNKAVAKGGSDNIENLRPICGPCNRGMGTKTIDWYQTKYFAKKSNKPKAEKPKKIKARTNKGIPSDSVLSTDFKIPKFKMPNFRI